MSMMPKVRYWSSSPRIVSASGVVNPVRHHLLLMTVETPKHQPQTVQIAKCINGAVSARLAAALQHYENNNK